MRAAKSHDIKQLPLPLRRAAERFQRWRSQRRRGTPIPEPLWTLAAQLAARFGVCKTASALKLDYYTLKSRLAESTPAGDGDLTAFLELPHAAAAAGECIIDCQNSVGARMRIHLKGVAFSDLAALGRSLWSAE
jgi:hypothetical protein